MDTPQAQKKAREARFFLGYMTETERERSNAEHFGFHLSAFLSAAKSVADVAERELRHGRYLKKWQDTLSEDDRVFFVTMTKFRDVEVHRDGVPTDVQRRAVPVEDVSSISQDRRTRALYSRIFAPPTPRTPEEVEEYKRLGIQPGTRAWVYADDYSLIVGRHPMKATAACERLLALLEDFLSYAASLPATETPRP